MTVAETPDHPPGPPRVDPAARRGWMAVLAKAPEAELEDAWQKLPEKPAYEVLRRPEIGLAMVQARAGGTGRRFNLGEMTMTRCAVRLDDGTVGFGHVAGRAKRRAELAAVLDALLQVPDQRHRVEGLVVAPLATAQHARRREAAARAAATRVEFFTLVRGD